MVKSNGFKKKFGIVAILIAVVLVVVLGNVFLKHKAHENFYSDYNDMNEFYKKVLYATGQEKEESYELMNNFEKSFDEFKFNYEKNPIDDIKDVKGFENSLNLMSDHINKARVNLDNGNLKDAHVDLEFIRNEWQRVFDSNQISMLGVLMTDFHDKMEIAIDSDGKSIDEMNNLCVELDKSWIKVENAKVDFSGDELNDFSLKVQEERANIDDFCSNLESDNLDELGSIMKKDFISVYLKYG